MAKELDKPKTEPLYVTTGEGLKDYTLPDEVAIAHGSQRTLASATTRVRTGFNRHDWDRHREEEKLPTEFGDIIRACQAVYRKVGLVRNIIDLMADFASEGLTLQHPIKTQQRFYREWARRVDLQDRAHDFMRLMLRDANVIVRRRKARITLPVKKEFTKGQDDDEPVERLKKRKKTTNKRTIPWRYTFISPTIVEKLGGDVGKFFGTTRVGIRLPAKLARAINRPKGKVEKELVAKLPPEIRQAAKSRNKVVELDRDNVHVSHYKKDDWEDWSTPFLFGILDDILFKEKMRLADMAALDGVINVIRLWRLGKSDKQILPTRTAVNKLLGILQHNVGGGVMDIVWDDMIDLKVEYPPTDKILGPEKYASVNVDIVKGLGIPDALVGGSDLSTRNRETAFVQLKTLTERLEYIRHKCMQWLEGELQMVADAMGFKRLPVIGFGRMSLRDEAAEKQLLVQLLDRGVISVESIHAAFGYDFMVELQNLRDEQKLRDEEPPVMERAGPYHRPNSVVDRQFEHQVRLQRARTNQGGGGDNPSGDQPGDEGENGPGRPPNVPDTGPRDERTSPTLSRVLATTARKFMTAIDKIADPAFLREKRVKGPRNLNAAQRRELERVKWVLLGSLDPGDSPTREVLSAKVPEAAGDRESALADLYEEAVEAFAVAEGKAPNRSQRRLLMAEAWAAFHSGGAA